MALWKATSVTVTNGSPLITVQTGDDVALIRPKSLLQVGNDQIVFVKRTFLGAGSVPTIELEDNWTGSSASGRTAVAAPTLLEIQDAVDEIRALRETYEDLSDNTSAFVESDILPAQNAGDVRTAIDVAQRQSSTTDTTAGRGLIVGAGGLLGISPDQDDTTVSNENKFVRIGGLFGGNLNTINLASSLSGRASQIGVRDVGGSDATPEIYARHARDGSFGPLVKIYHTGNILGAVSQSGGVPTGAIIQTITNANGTAIRYANGTQVCTQRISFSTESASSQAISWTYPASFNAAPEGSGLWVGGAAGVSTGLLRATFASTSASFTVGSFDGAAMTPSLTRSVSVTAIGRWFTP